MYDYLIVGAGFSGLVMAEQLTRKQGARCLLLEKRHHLGGNCYDYHDAHGVLVHRYGPHYFRTNSEAVLRYLSAFTQWIPATYQVLSQVGETRYQFPINLNTFEQLLGAAFSPPQKWKRGSPLGASHLRTRPIQRKSF